MENEISRNKIQEYSIQILTSFLICKESEVTIDVEGTVETVTGIPYSEAPIYLKEILITSLKNINEIIDYVSPYLNKWTFNRLNYCIQAILILSIVNNNYLKETNKPVTINIAVKLAKAYGDKDDYKFVNAILDNCLKDE